MEKTITRTGITGIESLRRLQIATNIIERLRYISRKLRKYNEYQCNYGELTKRQITMQNKLVIKASELALDLGFKVYFQNDPRGCALYIIDDTMDNSNYSNGLAIN